MLTRSLLRFEDIPFNVSLKTRVRLPFHVLWRRSGLSAGDQEQHLDGRSVWLSAKAPPYREQNSRSQQRGREAPAAIAEAKEWASFHLSKAHAEYAPDNRAKTPTPDRTRSSLDSPRESDQRAYRIRDGGVSSSTVVGGSIY